jgi:hypothetical protein
MIQLNTIGGYDQKVIDNFNKVSKKFDDFGLLEIILSKWCDDGDLADITRHLNDLLDENRPNVVLEIDSSVAIKYNGKLGMIKAQMGRETNDPNEEKWYVVSTDIDQEEHVKESDLIPDMFEHVECLPSEVQAILEKYSEADESYEVLAEMHNELSSVGY